jgi:hypothetical protein
MMCCTGKCKYENDMGDCKVGSWNIKNNFPLDNYPDDAECVIAMNRCDLVDESTMNKIDKIMETLKGKFTSGNQHPVEYSRITKEEYEVIKNFYEDVNLIKSGNKYINPIESYLK